MGMRSEHLRYAATLGGGEVPDSELDKCASHPVHNNGGIGFPLDRNKDGTPVLRNHQMLESVPKHRAMYLNAPVRVEAKQLEEEKLLQRRQQKLDEDYKNAETILSAALEVYTKAAPHKNDLSTAVDVMNEFKVLQLKQFIHARSLPTVSSRGAEFNHLNKLSPAAAKAGENCLLLAAFHCLSKNVQLRLPSRILPTPPALQPAYVATSDGTSNLDAIIERSEQPSHFLGLS